MKITPAPRITLSNGVQMPRLGLGTWPMNDAEAAVAVAAALDIGYRHIDTAENYENERGVGEGIRRSGVERAEVFVTTKFNRRWHSVDGVRQACEASLQRLGLDYVDLLLVHWPNPDQGRYVEAVEGLLNVQQAGLVRAIGTSNFKPTHLQRLFDRGLCPQVNQIQLDPYHTRGDVVAVHAAHGIVTVSWRPLGRAGALLADPVITDIARRHRRTPAQIVLRWQTQLGCVPVPKSADPQRLAQNLDVFAFVLEAEELSAISALDRVDPAMLDSDVFGH